MHDNFVIHPWKSELHFCNTPLVKVAKGLPRIKKERYTPLLLTKECQVLKEQMGWEILLQLCLENSLLQMLK
jgi:hypothetical protein